jgi:hypothetical protein
MPRKQRFKPSRKPKPVPQNDDVTLGRQEAGSIAHNENAPMHETMPPRDVNSRAEVEPQ